MPLQIRQGLLEWYDANHRILPWRRNLHSSRKAVNAELKCSAAPSTLSEDDFIYRVWISETMSQQTQLSRVVEYFSRWVEKWPNVKVLTQ